MSYQPYLERARVFTLDWFDRFRKGLRYRSIQLAFAAGGLGAYFQVYPDQYQGLVSHIPEVWRPVVGLIIFGALPAIVRLMKQNGITESS